MPVKIPIIFQDESIVIINKPAGIPSQPTVDPKRPDVFSLLKKEFPRGIFLHHRLDRDTSGIMLFSISKSCNSALTEMFRNHDFQKIYLSLNKFRDTNDKEKNIYKKSSLKNSNLDNKSFFGATNPHFEIESNLLDKSRFQNKEWIIENHLIGRRKDGKSIKMFRTESGGDYAKTHFKILKQWEDRFLLESKPVTGRTHQIRVHSLQSDLPIIGDSMYGGKDNQVPRIMLHAQSLSFPHPRTSEMMTFEAPIPQDFQTLIKKWDESFNSNHST